MLYWHRRIVCSYILFRCFGIFLLFLFILSKTLFGLKCVFSNKVHRSESKCPLLVFSFSDSFIESGTNIKYTLQSKQQIEKEQTNNQGMKKNCQYNLLKYHFVRVYFRAKHFLRPNSETFESIEVIKIQPFNGHVIFGIEVFRILLFL